MKACLTVLFSLFFAPQTFAEMYENPLRTAEAKEAEVIQTHNRYTLEACHRYAKGTQSATIGPVCDETEFDRNLAGLGHASWTPVRDELTKGFRDYLLQRVKNNWAINSAMVQCLHHQTPPPGILQGDDCAAAIATVKTALATNLPLMRKDLALAIPTTVAAYGDRSLSSLKPRDKVVSEIGHPDGGANIPSLNDDEIKKAADQFDADTATLLGEMPQQPDSPYQRLAIAAARQKKIYPQHVESYEKIIGESPNIIYLRARSVSDPDFDNLLANSYEELQKSLQKEKSKLENTNSVYSLENLAAYHSALDGYLTLYPPSRAECDVAQVLEDWIKHKETLKQVGIGAIAAVGTGLCAVTSGAACATLGAVRIAVAGAAASEAALIGRDQIRLERDRTEFEAGTKTLKDVKASKATRDLDLALAPTALLGTGLISRELQNLRLGWRAVKAGQGQLAEIWERALSAGQAGSLKEKLANTPAMKSEYEALTNSMLDLAKTKSQAIPIAVQDQLMTNINKAIANLGPNERLNVGYYTKFLHDATNAPAGSSAAVDALSNLKTQTEILRYINTQGGKTLSEKVDGFLAYVSLTLKRIPASQAQIYKSCVVGGATTAGSDTNGEILTCWQSSANGVGG